MAAITVRNLPPDLVERIKTAARRRGRSMEQEVRDLLLVRYAERRQVIGRIRERWQDAPAVAAEEVAAWRDRGRK